jgi:hypothetical protein
MAIADPADEAALVKRLKPVVLDQLAFSALGLRLSDEEELVGVAAIGLTGRLWRNTPIEDLHAGASAASRLEADIQAAGLSEARATSVRDAWRARREARGQADAAEMACLSQHPFPDETTRLDHVLADVRAGAGIPDDVMFRLNASTCSDVRSIVRALLADPPSDDGWVTELVADIWHPDRQLRVGDAQWWVGDLFDGLGLEWDDAGIDLPEEIYRSASTLSGLHDLVGFDALIRFLALYGASGASGWAGTPWWPRTVVAFAAHDAALGGHLLDDHVEALACDPELVPGAVARRRVELHWVPGLEATALDAFRSDRFRDVGRAPNDVSPLPSWTLLW